MKRKPYFTFLFAGLAFLIPKSSKAQQLGYEQTDVIKVAGITTEAQIGLLNTNQKQTSIIYYDGLGRSIQSVALQASPLQHDLIQPVVYDNLGRQTTSYLPYADQSANLTGSYRPNAVSTDQPAFYNNTSQYLIATDAAPYQQKVFENSPLQRLLQAGMVGNSYQPGVSGSHTKVLTYRTNTGATDGNILLWNADGTYTNGSYYADNKLTVTDGIDEDNIEALSFNDYTGRTILKRQMLGTTYLDTYYIYNIAGMLCYIVPPKATAILSANSYNLNTAPLSNLIFKFVYDNVRGRLTQKTVPGKGVMYIVYDPLNRPVLMQDANMRINKNWNYIKYDAKGRAISQGIYNDVINTTLATMQTYVNSLNYNTLWFEQRLAAGTNTGYYTNNIFPTTGITPLAFSYYDDYDLKQNGTPFTYVNQGLTGEVGATTAAIKGMPTMVWKTTVGSGLSGTWLLQVIFYDKRGNAIQTQGNNQVYYTSSTTLTDIKTNVPDFMGVPQITKVAKQTAASTTTIVLTTITYDQAYRVTSISQAYNGGASSTIATYSYNELGQIIKKNLGQLNTGAIATNLTLNTTYSGTNTFAASNSITMLPGFSVPSGAVFKAAIVTNYLQCVDFRYNIRGQLLSINNSKLSNDGGLTNTDGNDLFGMQLLYDQQDANMANKPLYDGRLTAVKWMSRNAGGISTNERSYKYNYDQLDRYTGENYAERAASSTGAFSTNTGGFDESGIIYDNGGNIKNLKRNSTPLGSNSTVEIDNLVYTYSTTNPNQLLNVTDGTDANHTGAGFRNYTGSTANYTYDVNGNLITDPKKGLSIAYNFLNRTDKITITTATNRYITYTYDAGGTLLRKQAYDKNTLQTTTDYVDGFVYVNSTLSYFPMPEGRVLNNSSTLKQEFIITDQQGNARISFQDNGNRVAVVKQENSYYGFGMLLPNSPVATPPTPNKNLYNGGSEWQNDFSNLPDYQQTFFRNYDAALGRWVAVDPMAESTESLTGYNYAGNNPIIGNDPNGDLTQKQWDDLIDELNSGGGGSFTVTSDDGNTNDGTAGGGGNSSIYHLSNNAAFQIGAAYLDRYNLWGQDGFAKNYVSAVLNYDFNRPDGTPAILATQQRYVVTGGFFRAEDGSNTTVNNLSGAFYLLDLGATNQGGDVTKSLDKLNTGVGAFAFGWTAKDVTFDYLKKTGADLEGIAGYAKFVKVIAVSANIINAGVVVTKVVINKQIMPSDILEGAAAGASFIPGFGWAIGSAYFLGDIATKSLTGKSIGEHLNDYYGDKPIVSW